MISEKKMVFEILKESKKPLMAKRIAYLLFQRYDSFKMSRFRVREILWKEMKGQFEYDNVNYTYLIKNSIRETEKIKTEINFELLLTPFIYNIPNKKNLIDNYTFYQTEYKKTINFNLNGDLENISIVKWLSMLESLKEKLTNNKKLKESDSYYILKENLKNPFYYYSLLIDTNKSKNNILFSSEKFQRIFDEITRDNLITKAEESYLFEKGEEFLINIDIVKDAIEKLDFKAYKSFKLLIDEICEDGIISTTEREYIKEKAIQYNVNEGLLDRMIDTGLKKVKFIKNHRENIVFYDYLKHLYLCISLKIDIDNEFYEVNEQIDCPNQYLNDEISIMVKEIKIKLNKDFLFDSEGFKIDQFLDKIGIKVISHYEAIKEFNYEDKGIKKSDIEIITSRGQFEIKKNKLDRIKINNTHFLIKKSKLPFHDLFSHEFKRETGENFIIINLSHELYEKKSESLIIKIAASMHFTKLTMTDPNISRFIERINNNLDLIENEY